MKDNQNNHFLYQLIDSLIRAIEIRDQYTARHQCATSALARSLAQELGLSAFEVEGVRVAGQLHDIGKIAIPSQLLSKVGSLTKEEFALVKTHVNRGVEILSGVDFPWPIETMVAQHHERMDGSGYPNNLKNHEIYFGARILAVADTANAVINARPYRKAMGIECAISIFEADAGKCYDTDVVSALLSLIKKKGATHFDEVLASL